MQTKKLTPKLDTILANKRMALASRRASTPLEAVRALASMQERPNPVLSMVSDRDDPVQIIGQIKHTPATNGTVVYDPVGAALRYANKRVDAVSLFTDGVVYDYGLDDLMLVARAINLPVISQDYVLDEYEIVETRAAGASALVLSAAVLDKEALRALISDTQRNRMTAIVAVHNEDELHDALSLSPNVIGLTSDNPLTPEIELNLAQTRRLRSMIPPNVRVMVMEKLATVEQVDLVASLQVDAILVNENLLDTMQHADNLRARLSQ